MTERAEIRCLLDERAAELYHSENGDDDRKGLCEQLAAAELEIDRLRSLLAALALPPPSEVQENKEDVSRVDRSALSPGQDLPRKPPRGCAEDDDETCDGCAQARPECLCGVDLADVMDCNHPSHPGCRKCEVP